MGEVGEAEWSGHRQSYYGGTVKTNRFLAAALAAVAFGQSGPGSAQIARLLTADALKADVSYLASDELEGRGTPSPGLDKAAEYIASQFRAAGLEAAGDDGYFQTAMFATVEANREGLEVTVEIAGQRFAIASAAVNVMQTAAADLNGAAAMRIGAKELATLSVDEARGKVLLIEAGRLPSPAALGDPAAVFVLTAAGPARAVRMAPREASAPLPRFPVVTISDAALRAAVAAAPDAEIKISAHLAAPTVKTFPLRNVVGVLRGCGREFERHVRGGDGALRSSGRPRVGRRRPYFQRRER